jgi:hypothetical protein
MIRKIKTTSYFVGRHIILFFLFLYLWTFGFIFKTNRALFFKIFHHFGFFLPKEIKTTIPEVSVDKILKTRQSVSITEPVWRQGNTTAYELAVLGMFINEFNPKSILEMGTFDGRTTLNLALNSSPDTKVYTIDLQKNEDISPQ